MKILISPPPYGTTPTDKQLRKLPVLYIHMNMHTVEFLGEPNRINPDSVAIGGHSSVEHCGPGKVHHLLHSKAIPQEIESYI